MAETHLLRFELVQIQTRLREAETLLNLRRVEHAKLTAKQKELEIQHQEQKRLLDQARAEPLALNLKLSELKEKEQILREDLQDTRQNLVALDLEQRQVDVQITEQTQRLRAAQERLAGVCQTNEHLHAQIE